MRYTVTSFIGDYPVENQPCWNLTYPNYKAAIKAAKGQHRKMSPEYDNLYTVIMKENNSYKIYWLMYDNQIIKDLDEATRIADDLGKRWSQ